MHPRTIRRLLTLLGLALISATVALSQPTQSTSQWNRTPSTQTWMEGETFHYPPAQLFIVTKDHPASRRFCSVVAVDADKLTCSRHIGKPVTYAAQTIAALIIPGEQPIFDYLISAAVGGAGAAATWGTVVLAASCLPCAVATGATAAILYWVALFNLAESGSYFPEQLMYLAPGQTLQAKLH